LYQTNIITFWLPILFYTAEFTPVWRVLDLLEPGDLRLGQVVIKRVAVVKLGVNNGSGDGGRCFGPEVWTDTAKLTDMVIARFGDR